MLLRNRADRRPSGFVEPCRPTKATRPPTGPLWVHEIKHDGFRLLVRREGSRVRCFTRNGFDWAERFPAIVEAARHLKAQSFLIDGEAVVCRPDGISDFDALRVGRRAHEVTLAAFDLIELRGEDLRNEPLLKRKQSRMGLEGIVSKRLDAPYRSGPSKTWLKSKNPLSAAVRREREDEWNS
jgi:bifunctional non-homologous end joining protein LigD